MNRLIFAAVVMLFTNCTFMPSGIIREESRPDIFPDYQDVTIPRTISPLNFYVNTDCTSLITDISGSGIKIRIRGKRKVIIPRRKWRRMIERADSLLITVHAKVAGEWVHYESFPVYVSDDPIDPVITYRRVDPGYAFYNEMGIYQRDITSFREKPLIVSTMYGNSCVNCHSFSGNDPEKLQFHIRGSGGATLIKKDGVAVRVDTKADALPGSCRYPYWHPSGNFILYSINNTLQIFHNHPERILDVFDTESDLVIYDVNRNELKLFPILMDSTKFETFPAFSADGNTIWFCSAESKNQYVDLEDTRYSLCSVSFDSQSGIVGDSIRTVFSSESTSVAFPRPSPDGRFLTFTTAGYGTFPIWHQDAEIWIMDLQSGIARIADEINSQESDSYHSWSSESRWIVFGSRRNDGLHTRLFIAHVDANGKFSKPFQLPQRDPLYNEELLQSFNIPEFVTGVVSLSPRQIKNAPERKVSVKTYNISMDANRAK